MGLLDYILGLFGLNKGKALKQADSVLNVPKTVQESIPYLGVYENLSLIHISEPTRP